VGWSSFVVVVVVVVVAVPVVAVQVAATMMDYCTRMIRALRFF
jgi:hypothetical protein